MQKKDAIDFRNFIIDLYNLFCLILFLIIEITLYIKFFKDTNKIKKKNSNFQYKLKVNKKLKPKYLNFFFKN